MDIVLLLFVLRINILIKSDNASNIMDKVYGEQMRQSEPYIEYQTVWVVSEHREIFT